jgi:hypothetical protein
MTQHRVDGGRRGPCLECIAKRELSNAAARLRKLQKDAEDKERKRQNPGLFE